MQQRALPVRPRCSAILMLVCALLVQAQTNVTFTVVPVATAAPMYAGHVNKFVPSSLETFLPTPAALGLFGAATVALLGAGSALNPPLFAGRKAVLEAAVSIANCDVGPETYDPPTSIVVLPVADGDASTKNLQGGMIENMVFILIWLLLWIISMKLSRYPMPVRRFIGNASCTMVVYFTGCVMWLAANLINNGVGGADSLLGFGGLVLALLIFVVHTVLSMSASRGQFTEMGDLFNPQHPIARQWHLPIAANVCMVQSKAVKHCVVLPIEFCVSLVMQLLGGLQTGGCLSIGIAAIILLALRFVYTIVVRPYRAVAMNAAAVALSAWELIIACAATFASSSPGLFIAVGFAVLLQIILYAVFISVNAVAKINGTDIPPIPRTRQPERQPEEHRKIAGAGDELPWGVKPGGGDAEPMPSTAYDATQKPEGGPALASDYERQQYRYREPDDRNHAGSGRRGGRLADPFEANEWAVDTDPFLSSDMARRARRAAERADERQQEERRRRALEEARRREAIAGGVAVVSPRVLPSSYQFPFVFFDPDLQEYIASREGSKDRDWKVEGLMDRTTAQRSRKPHNPLADYL